MHRRHLDLLRGLTALALLLVLLVGLPIALVTAVGWPLPTELPTWTAFERTLTRGELDSWTLVKALAFLVWLAWAQLTASALAELVAILRGRRATAVPSSRALRHAAANLVTTAALLFSSAGRLADAATPPPPELHVALATAPPATALPGAALPGTTGQPRMQLAAAPTATDTPPAGAPDRTAAPTWRVQPRETLWGIAETVLGDGRRWREIHDLNIGRPQPDGDTLRRDDDLIRPGWVLNLPPDATTSKTADDGPPTDRPEATSPETSMTTITVEPGDTLWDLAAAHLDDPHRWPELYEKNRHRAQPDGRHLTDPDLIHPGWQLTVPTAGDHRTEPAEDADAATAPAEKDTPETLASPGPAEQQPIPWATLQPGLAPSPEPSHEAHATDDETPTPPHAAPSTNRSTTRKPPADDAAGDPDEEHEDADNSLVLLVGAGLLAAGAIATLDRIRRGKLRRRQPGQRIVLPKGSLARTEQRVRGLADADTADLLDVVLRSLVAACNDVGRDVPRIALVSVGPHDVAVHLADLDDELPDGWQLEDGGMTWVTPRPADLDGLRDLAASALSPVPLLVTIGTHAHGQRRVLLNLGHARLLDLHADDETTRTVILSQALELATAARADALSVLLAGAGDVLATLERVRCLPEDAAVELLRRAVEDADSEDPEATAALFVTPPPPDIEEALAAGPDGPNTVAAVAPQLPNATWRLTIEPTSIRVAPHGLELEPLELTSDDLDAIADLLEDAAIPTFVAATPEEPDELVTTDEVDEDDDADEIDEADALPLVAHSTNGQEAPGPAARIAEDQEQHIEVRVLGPVEVAGANEFESAKAEELVVYLALHRDPVDTDTLQEALWPGQPPNAGRLHTTVWRARQALGDDPDGKPYLPKAKQGRYRISPAVSSDLGRFHEHVRRARSEPDSAATELRSALELVRGRPLSATSGEYAWIINELHAIEQDVSDTAHQLAELFLEHDQPQEARWAAERGLLADPYCELLYRELMLAARADGNTPEVRSIMRRLKLMAAGDADANDADDLLDTTTIRLYDELVRAVDP